MTLHHELLDRATTLAKGAGKILTEGRARGFGAVESKSTLVDIVTEVDKASEAFLVEGILRHRPDDGVLGEEGTSFEGTSGVKWIVDPLDGTVNFTYGFPFYAVSIGIEIDGERVVGVVYNPAIDELFTGCKGEGAYLNGTQIHTGDTSDLTYTLLSTGFPYDAEGRKRQAERLLTLLPVVRDLRRGGSAALDLCSVACGRVDAHYEVTVHPWDVAGGDVIASEAGALVTGLNTDRTTTDTLAANPRLHRQLRGLIESA